MQVSKNGASELESDHKIRLTCNKILRFSINIVYIYSFTCNIMTPAKFSL